MAVISCKLKPGSRRGPIRRSGGGWSYYETYVVVTDDATDDGTVVERAKGLPHRGQAYDGDGLAICTELDPQQVGGHDRVWAVQARYETIARQRKEPQRPEDITPQNYPPRRSWSTAAYEEHPLTDLDGKAYKNSAGDWIQGIVRIKRNRVLTIEEYLLKFNNDQAEEFQDAINEDALHVLGKQYPPFAAKLNEYVGVEEHFPQGGSYWIRTAVIEFNRDLWHPHKELDKGPQFLDFAADPKNPPLVAARDEGDVLHGGEILLTAKGGKLPKTVKKPHLLEFKEYHALPFGRLMLALK